MLRNDIYVAGHSIQGLTGVLLPQLSIERKLFGFDKQTLFNKIEL